MKHLRTGILFLIALLLLAPALPAAARKGRKAKTEQPRTGAEDRALWVDLLWKISYPVVHNLAEGTLRRNMPIENPYGKPEDYRDVTHLEAVGRTLCGLAPWLALPDDDSREGQLRRQMREEVLRGLRNAVDPDSPDCLNFKRHNQPIVDAAFLVHAFLRAPKALWEPLDEVTKQRYVAALRSLRDRCGAYNNWLLFNGLNEAFLDRYGGGGDPFRMTMAKNKMQEWYVGDGWYSDGAKFSMDYYNSFVIHPMMVALLETMAERRRAGRGEFDQALKRMVRYAEFLGARHSPRRHLPAFRPLHHVSLCRLPGAGRRRPARAIARPYPTGRGAVRAHGGASPPLCRGSKFRQGRLAHPRLQRLPARGRRQLYLDR